MRSQVSVLKPKRRHAGAIAAALLLSLVAGGVAVASAHFPQFDQPYPAREAAVSRHDLPIYWYAPHRTFDR